jgi:hypothetical protein
VCSLPLFSTSTDGILGTPGVPATATSDIYNSYFIPKGLYLAGLSKVADYFQLLGVAVIANIWQVHTAVIVKLLE